jgi:hypothetical protein
VATIDLSAGKGKSGLAVGGRVRISGTGLYAGEIAVIERLVSGVIPQAVVRTEAGKTRQVRTIDLEPVAAGAFSLRVTGSIPVSRIILAAPRTDCAANIFACSLSMPPSTAASINASMYI